MKNIFYTLLIIIISFSGKFCLAQNEAQEAEKELKNASSAIQQSNYQNALGSIDNAKKMVVKLLSEQIAAALPAKVGDWVQSETSESDRMMGAMMSRSAVNVSRTYMVEKEGAAKSEEDISAGEADPMSEGMMAGMENPVIEPAVTVTITDDFSQSMEVSRAHSNQEMAGLGMGGGQISEPIKVQGYRALLKYMDKNKQGSLAVIVGAASVRIEGRNIDNKEILKKFADLVDFNLIKSILGE